MEGAAGPDDGVGGFLAGGELLGHTWIFAGEYLTLVDPDRRARREVDRRPALSRQSVVRNRRKANVYPAVIEPARVDGVALSAWNPPADSVPFVLSERLFEDRSLEHGRHQR
ncbi:hypothetical protein CV102_02815 [Natronococcus pandeyae]|uniref:Uncharacterized protein n=1 Tax=Natronococcus pandeyae TaxID=2055836 RepID=A0A8J8Q7G4_9EURY|nr:hypothetical protein CV102_02815 [Natronococcus pandeyae]